MNKISSVAGKLRDLRTNLRFKLAANYDINGYRRIYHIHIRKTGGTSLNYMFISLVKGMDTESAVYGEMVAAKDHRVMREGKIYVGWNDKLIDQGHYYYAFAHTPLHLLALPPKTFTITVLRDPVKRVLSHYRMLVEYRENKVDHPAMKREGDWLGESLDDFLDRIPAEDLLRQVYMFSPQFNVDEAYREITNCSHFMFTEDFEAGTLSLNSKLGVDLKSIHMRRTKSSPQISEKQISRLRDMLVKEYELVDRLKVFQASEVIK